MTDADTWKWLISAILFLVLAAYGGLVVTVWRKKKPPASTRVTAGKKAPHPTRHVLVPMIIALLLRCAWFLSHFEEGNHTFFWRIISRLSILLQFTACLNLVFIWFSVSLFANIPDVEKKKKMWWYMVYALNIVFYLAVLSTTRGTSGQGQKGVNTLYRINIFLLALVFVIIFVGVFARGRKLMGLIKNLNRGGAQASEEAEDKSKRALKQITRISLIFLICFLIRSVMFSFTPITGKYKFDSDTLNDLLYPWFYYHLPEGLPAFTLFWSFTDKVKAKAFFTDNICKKKREEGGGSDLEIGGRAGSEVI